MAAYCKSCFRDLPSDDAACRTCSASAASISSPLIGVLLFGVVMAGMLTFDARLYLGGAAVAILAIAVQLTHAMRLKR